MELTRTLREGFIPFTKLVVERGKKEGGDKVNQIKYYKCFECYCDLVRDKVWVSDEGKAFCYDHAPAEAIRLQDTIQQS